MSLVSSQLVKWLDGSVTKYGVVTTDERGGAHVVATDLRSVAGDRIISQSGRTLPAGVLVPMAPIGVSSSMSDVRFASPGIGFDCYYIAGISGDSAALSAHAPTLNALIAVPFTIAKQIVVDRLAFNVSVVGGAGAKAHAGIYAADTVTGYPTSLLVDGGEVDTTLSTGSKIAVVNATLAPGLYWFALAAWGSSTPMLCIDGASGATHSLGWRSTFASQQAALVAVQTYSPTLPAVYPAGATDATNPSSTSFVPAIGIRIASIS